MILEVLVELTRNIDIKNDGLMFNKKNSDVEPIVICKEKRIYKLQVLFDVCSFIPYIALVCLFVCFHFGHFLHEVSSNW